LTRSWLEFRYKSCAFSFRSAPRFSLSPPGVEQLADDLPQAARDRFRRDLSNVIAVVRLPTGAESTWVALVRKDAADTSGLARFNRAAPNFLTWVLEKTRKDHRALLASQPASGRSFGA
jgi:hypothetical protein